IKLDNFDGNIPECFKNKKLRKISMNSFNGDLSYFHNHPIEWLSMNNYTGYPSVLKSAPLKYLSMNKLNNYTLSELFPSLFSRDLPKSELFSGNQWISS